MAKSIPCRVEINYSLMTAEAVIELYERGTCYGSNSDWTLECWQFADGTIGYFCDRGRKAELKVRGAKRIARAGIGWQSKRSKPRNEGKGVSAYDMTSGWYCKWHEGDYPAMREVVDAISVKAQAVCRSTPESRELSKVLRGLI